MEITKHQQSDVELMIKAKAGNEDAIGEIMSRYTEHLIMFSMQWITQQQDVEDIIQETFIRCWEKFDLNKTRFGSLKNFLETICRNLIFNKLPRKKPVNIENIDSEGLKNPNPDSTELEILGLQDVILKALRERHRNPNPTLLEIQEQEDSILRALLEEERIILMLRINSFTEKEIAEKIKWLFSVRDFQKPSQFIINLRDAHENSVSLYLRQKLSELLRSNIIVYHNRDEPDQDFLNNLAVELTQLIKTRLYQPNIFDKITLPSDIKELTGKQLQEKELPRLNWGLLEAAYPKQIKRTIKDQSYISKRLKKIYNKVKRILD